LLDDPVRARALGEMGRQLVCEEFTAARMVTEVAGLYREVLARELARQPVLPT
jgi:hypothetical protein